MELMSMLILSVALSLPGVGTPEQRQVLPPPFCGELSQTDCQILVDAQALMMEVGSITLDWQVEAAVSGIPDLTDEDLRFETAMTMNVRLDPLWREQFDALRTDSPEELLDDQGEFTQKAVDLYENLDMELDMQMTLPAVLSQIMEADADLVLPDTLKFEMRMVDGYVYINMDRIAESDPTLAAEMQAAGIQGWIGFDFISLLEQQMGSAGEAPDPALLGSMQMGMAFDQMMADESVRTLLESYRSIERLADEERDGTPVAIFRTSFDLARLVANPDFTRILRETADSLVAASGETIDPQELGMAILGVQLVANVLTRSFEFQHVQAIGVEKPYLYDGSTVLEMDLSGLVTLLEMSGEEMPPTLRDAQPLFNLTVETRYADFDNVPAIEAPEDAEIIPLDSLDENNLDAIL
jgi:hypothetical protein